LGIRSITRSHKDFNKLQASLTVIDEGILMVYQVLGISHQFDSNSNIGDETITGRKL